MSPEAKGLGSDYRASMWSNEIVHPGFLGLQFHFLTSSRKMKQRRMRVLRKDTLGPYRNGGRVPRQESLGLHLLAIHFNVCDVVLEDCRDIDLRELILAEDNEKAGLPTGPVAHNHQFLPYCSHGLNWQSRGRGFGRKKRTQ